MASSIIIVTFDDVMGAGNALTILKKMRNERMFKLSDAVVVTKDIEGVVTVKETADVTGGKGAVAGGIAGLVIGTLVGGPIGGALLGAAAGGITAKAIDVGIPKETVDQVSRGLHIANSAILVQLKEGDAERLASALEATGGVVYALAIGDEAERQLEETLGEAGETAG